MRLFDLVKNIPHGAEVIAGWVGSGGEVVDSETSQARADTCTGRLSGTSCPKNDLRFTPVEAVALAVKKYLSVKNSLSLRVLGERSLGTCRLCGCTLRLQVHEPQDKVKSELTDEEKQQAPEFCWKLK